MQPDNQNPASKIEFKAKASLTDEERLRVIADVLATSADVSQRV